MSTNHKKEILELLESGKIDAAEAARLLSQPAEEEAGKTTEAAIEFEEEPVVASAETGSASRMFRVRVKNMETGKNKVSVNIPVRMLRLGLKLGSHFSPELNGLDLSEINEMMGEMGGGMLVEVEDEESNEHVQVFID